METVDFNGVSYTKASVVAKNFRYTADYLGQLCRAKKVDARLVGRTWFVNSDSVVAHRKKKFAKTNGAKKTKDLGIDTTSEIKLHRVNVPPVITSKTARVLQKAQTDDINRSKKLHVFYELDDETLIPNLTRKETPPPTKLFVEPADAKKVSIKGAKKEVNFTPTALPDIALSGTLKVTTYADRPVEESSIETPVQPPVTNESENTESPKNKDFLHKISDKKVKKLKVKLSKKDIKTEQTHLSEESITKTKTSPVKPVTMSGIVKKTSNQPASANKTAIQVSQQSELKSNELPIQSLDAPLPAVVRFSPAIATTLALMCAAVLFSTSSQIVVLESVHESKIVLQLANVIALFQ